MGREKERGKKSFCPKRRDQVGKDILVEKRPQQTPSGQSESAAEATQPICHIPGIDDGDFVRRLSTFQSSSDPEWAGSESGYPASLGACTSPTYPAG